MSEFVFQVVTLEDKSKFNEFVTNLVFFMPASVLFV